MLYHWQATEQCTHECIICAQIWSRLALAMIMRKQRDVLRYLDNQLVLCNCNFSTQFGEETPQTHPSLPVFAFEARQEESPLL